jgi:hypothetical protein
MQCRPADPVPGADCSKQRPGGGGGRPPAGPRRRAPGRSPDGARAAGRSPPPALSRRSFPAGCAAAARPPPRRRPRPAAPPAAAPISARPGDRPAVSRLRHHSVASRSALTRAIRSRSSWRGHPRSGASSAGRKVSQQADIGKVLVGEDAEIDDSRPDFVTEFVCPEDPWLRRLSVPGSPVPRACGAC